MEAEDSLGVSSIELEEISLPSSTVIEGLLQEHPSLLSLSDVQEAVSVSKSTQECLKPEPEPVFQVTEKVVKTGPRKGNTEQKVTLGKWFHCEPTTRPPFRQSPSLSFYLVRTIKTFQQWWRTPELSNRDFSSSRLTELTEEDLSSIQFVIADSQSR